MIYYNLIYCVFYHCDFMDFSAGVLIKLLTVVYCHPILSSFIKIQNGSTFLVPAYPGSCGTKTVSADELDLLFI